jgi:hypothetical protein
MARRNEILADAVAMMKRAGAAFTSGAVESIFVSRRQFAVARSRQRFRFRRATAGLASTTAVNCDDYFAASSQGGFEVISQSSSIKK